MGEWGSGVRWTLLAAAMVATCLATPATAASSCPNPKTCRAYVLDAYRWPVPAGQPLVLHYRVNPVNPYVAQADVPRMVAAATRVWERANPRVHFHFDGMTTALPGVLDGVNVVGWGPPLDPVELAHAAIFTSGNGTTVVEADLSLNLAAGTRWHECPQRDGGCQGHATPDATGTYTGEVQGVVEHELGHWLSLNHPDALGGSEMTMSAVDDPRLGLTYQTLGLGDVLGVRAAYPCGRCGGAPKVYAP